jgi:hypothetical protein
MNNMPEKITCKCGSVISKSQISVHTKTKKHISRIKIRMFLTALEVYE